MPTELVHLADKDIILVGTAHVSKTSIEEVETSIREHQPDTVAVELCQNRYDVIKNPKRWQDTDIIKIIKEKKSAFLFANLVMASFQKRLGAKIGVRPGDEMRAAMEQAEGMDIPVSLVDRSVQITLQRAWRSLSLWEKIKLIFTSLISIFAVDDLNEDEIEKLKEKDVLTAAVEEMAKTAPTVKKVLIDERDEYMAKKISDIKGKKVLAVVGAGHMEGLIRHMQDPIEDIGMLEDVPVKKKGIWKWVIPIIILVLVTSGFFFGGSDQGYEMLKWWLLSNAFFAAIGAMLAFGHPLTILVAALASPITSLNPTLAAGWFAGLSEAYLKKPRVSDFESLQDIASVKEFWSNPITRILLVVIFANTGSSMGAFIAMPILTKIVITG